MNNADKEVELRSGTLLQLAPCWLEGKQSWRENYCDPEVLRKASLGPAPPPGGDTPSTPQKRSVPALSSPSPSRGSSLAAHDIGWEQNPLPNLFDVRGGEKVAAVNVLETTAAISSSQIYLDEGRGRPKRSTDQRKFDIIREKVWLAMKEFGEISIDEVASHIMQGSSDRDTINNTCRARDFYENKNNEMSLSNYEIASKLSTWATNILNCTKRSQDEEERGPELGSDDEDDQEMYSCTDPEERVRELNRKLRLKEKEEREEEEEEEEEVAEVSAPPARRGRKGPQKAGEKAAGKGKENVKKTKAGKVRASKAAKSRPKQLFNNSVAPVTGKRLIKQPQKYDPIEAGKASDVIVGTGFACLECGQGMAYDETKCDKCGAITQYVPGIGAVLSVDRSAISSARAGKAAASAAKKKKPPAAKKQKNKRKKKSAPRKDESEAESEVDCDDEEGEDSDDHSLGYVRHQKAKNKAPPKARGGQRTGSGWEQRRFFKSFTPLPRVQIKRVELMPTQTQDYDSDDEEYEAEMKLYRKGLVQRKALAERERKEMLEYEEEMERKEINAQFFGQVAQRSEASKEREEQLNAFVRCKPISNAPRGMRSKCDNSLTCRFCNNYWGKEVNEMDFEVEPKEAMPSFRKIEVDEQPISRKRKLALAEFALVYNSRLIRNGEADGGWDAIQKQVLEQEQDDDEENLRSNKRRKY